MLPKLASSLHIKCAQITVRSRCDEYEISSRRDRAAHVRRTEVPGRRKPR